MQLAQMPGRRGHTHSLPNGTQGRTGCGRMLKRFTRITRDGAEAIMSISCGSCLGDAVRRGWMSDQMIVTDLGRAQ